MPTSILLIEDDHDTRVCLRDALESEGYKVFSATNGRDGIEILRNIQAPALILLDMMMPIMSGQQFLERRKADPELAAIPVVVISAQLSQFSTAGASQVISKPIELSSLLRAIQKYR